MKTKVHVVPHSHWDREWYFTTSRSKIYLMKDFKDVIDTLENNDEFKYFMIDAQASLLDDYLNWMPEDESRIKSLVQKGKLIIGPWYTQTDQLVISGESIVRNLYYGIERCKDFGDYMKVGYVPDSFGQSAQMPQIYSGFGIKDSLFWRGVSDDMTDCTEFNWKGSDGTVAFAVQIPYGYFYGGNIPEDIDELKVYLEEQVGRLKKVASTNNVYFPNGFDQAPIRINLPEILKKANEIDKENEYVISSIENYIKSVKAEKNDFKELEGEFVTGKHMRIHKSIFSSRADLKMMNNHIENYIVNVVEPILAMSHVLGNEYPHTIMKDIWKLMFGNAAHDSIGACNSDTTNEDVYMRYKQARDLSVNLLELHMRLVATKIKKNDEEITLTLFNAYPKDRSEVIEFEAFIPQEDFIIKNVYGKELRYVIKAKEDISSYVLDQTIRLNPSKKIYIPSKVYKATIVLMAEDIPSMGYCQVVFELNKKNNFLHEESEGNVIENNYYKIYAKSNGTIDILDKTSNKIYKNQAVFEENGDAGDSYNYSPPREDLLISSLDSKSQIKVLKSKIEEELLIQYDMKVPCSLEERAKGIVSIDMKVEVNVSLKENQNVISFNVDLENKSFSHRVRVLFNAEIASKLSIADQQFGIISRKTVLEEDIKLWESSEGLWQEKPITIEPMQSFVTLEDGKRGLCVITQGVREYQIVGEKYDTIALTLFRTFSYMGRENLLYRPGRSSGEKIVETPDAQLIGKLKFTFGVHIFNCEFDEANIANIAKKYLTPIQVYQYADFLNGRMIFALRDEKRIYENKYSLFNVKDENFTVSSIKKQEKGEGLVIRIFNPMKTKLTEGKFIINKRYKRAYNAMLDESYCETDELKINEGIIEPNTLTHCKVQTIILD
ncbi:MULTISPECIES: mannosylglycerate hydrolase [Clostridium]|uniref:Mannosylglycerate hydrolase n=1 Tax=Clostridium frigoriphilum TaxID=443253 RepID=A0ABU7UUC2_9CLOT|nr:mannosylglycerate hydrolase [Clostridium sp. DSM 17811]MBU3101981.1 mannosylglycerate hydrolase [Clostridium sp. DSM 17811]